MNDKKLAALLEQYKIPETVRRNLEVQPEQRELPDVVKRVLREIRKEKGLTYARAYTVLEIAYNQLAYEAQFISHIEEEK